MLPFVFVAFALPQVEIERDNLQRRINLVEDDLDKAEGLLRGGGVAADRGMMVMLFREQRLTGLMFPWCRAGH